MRIKWLGHACFVIESNQGIKVLTDPYKVEKNIKYTTIDEEADIILVSHDHWDHNNTSVVKGDPVIINKSGKKKIKGISITGVSSYHDNSMGRDRGPNTIYTISIEGMNVCHLGDLGHILNQDQINEIGSVDILLIPVGGTYTIDSSEATIVCGQLKPRIVIPMHFRNEKCEFPVDDVTPFIKDKKAVERTNSSEITIEQSDFKDDTRIIVLSPS
jgi:L-ascorbate metabolism protein UlaG (beta-lactamase superfamily)